MILVSRKIPAGNKKLFEINLVLWNLRDRHEIQTNFLVTAASKFPAKGAVVLFEMGSLGWLKIMKSCRFSIRRGLLLNVPKLSIVFEICVWDVYLAAWSCHINAFVPALSTSDNRLWNYISECNDERNKNCEENALLLSAAADSLFFRYKSNEGNWLSEKCQRWFNACRSHQFPFYISFQDVLLIYWKKSEFPEIFPEWIIFFLMQFFCLTGNYLQSVLLNFKKKLISVSKRMNSCSWRQLFHLLIRQKRIHSCFCVCAVVFCAFSCSGKKELTWSSVWGRGSEKSGKLGMIRQGVQIHKIFIYLWAHFRILRKKRSLSWAEAAHWSLLDCHHHSPPPHSTPFQCVFLGISSGGEQLTGQNCLFFYPRILSHLWMFQSLLRIFRSWAKILVLQRPSFLIPNIYICAWSPNVLWCTLFPLDVE